VSDEDRSLEPLAVGQPPKPLDEMTPEELDAWADQVYDEMLRNLGTDEP